MYSLSLRIHPIWIWFRSSWFGVHPLCHDVSLHCATTLAYFHTARGFSSPLHSFVPSASECEMDLFYDDGEDLAISPPLFVLHCFHAFGHYHCRALRLNFVVSRARRTFGLSPSERVPQTDTLERVGVPPLLSDNSHSCQSAPFGTLDYTCLLGCSTCLRFTHSH